MPVLPPYSRVRNQKSTLTAHPTSFKLNALVPDLKKEYATKTSFRGRAYPCRNPYSWELLMAKISKPDANPVVALLLTWFLLGSGHFIVNGQKTKWIKIMIAWLIGTILCCLPGTVIAILSIIDAYKTAQKLKAGKEIDENEYSVELLYKIVSKIHKEAIFVP
jgi:TM2 domain-containing membrane protein YozV